MQSPELSPEILIAIGIALLAAGIGIGLLLGRRSSPGAERYRDTERKLDQVLQEKKTYEDEVVEHFADTARMLNNLTESYRDVHNQLATGAAKLCKDQGPVSLGVLKSASDTEIPASLTNTQPPLDYAPKTSPDEKGMLNEEFGFDQGAAPAKNPSETTS